MRTLEVTLADVGFRLIGIIRALNSHVIKGGPVMPLIKRNNQRIGIQLKVAHPKMRKASTPAASLEVMLKQLRIVEGR